MKIVIITEYFPESEKGELSGGVEARAFNIATGLAKSKKYDVTVIAGRTGSSKEKSQFSNITVLRPVKHKYSHGGAFFSRFRFAFAALKTAKKLDADIIDGYNFISYLPAYFAGKKIGAKKIATYHETWLGEWIKNKGIITGTFGSLWERFVLFRDWDKIISVSEFTRKRLIKAGIKKNLITVIPNGVNLSEFKKIKSKKFKNPTICCISRLVKTKKVEDLINALLLIKKEIPNIECKIIGVGEERKNLEELAKKNKVEKNVEFIGFVKKAEDVKKILKSSHLLCHPSILEGFGMVIVEAMACGVPYVCSDIDPLVEVTENGKGGLIFKRQNSKDLAEKAIRLLKDKRLYSKKKKEAERLVSKYEWQNIVKKTEKIYHEI